MKPKSPPERDYTTGRAASELHVSSSHVRALCQAGIIAARATHGGHWRIPKGEVERLRREGVPDPPPATPTDANHDVEAESPSSPNPSRHPALLAEPSTEAIASADEVVRLENEVRGIQLKRAKEESLDWFRERQRQQAELQAARERQRLDARALRLRRDWENAWIEYGLQVMPDTAPESFRLAVTASIREALDCLNLDDPEEMTEPLVRAAVDSALQPWRREKQIESAIQEARNQLPCWAKAYPDPSEWELRAIRAASAEIARLRTDATLEEIRAAAIGAGRIVAKQYQHQQEIRKIVESVFLSHSRDDQERARQSVRAALETLPLGANRAHMELTAKRVLEPFKAADQAASVQATAFQQAEMYLLHIDTYLGSFALNRNLGDFSRRRQLATKLKNEIRPILIQEILEEPMSSTEAHTFIESLIKRRIEQ